MQFRLFVYSDNWLCSGVHALSCIIICNLHRVGIFNFRESTNIQWNSATYSLYSISVHPFIILYWLHVCKTILENSIHVKDCWYKCNKVIRASLMIFHIYYKNISSFPYECTIENQWNKMKNKYIHSYLMSHFSSLQTK